VNRIARDLVVLLCVLLVAGIGIAGQGLGDLTIAPTAVFLHLSEGEPYEGVFSVTNNAEEPVLVEVILKDFNLMLEGGFITLDPGEMGEYSLAVYISYEPQEMTLDPGESQEVVYSVLLPANTEGPHWVSLVVGPKEGAIMGSSEGGATSLGVRVKIVHPFAILIHSPVSVEPTAKIIDTNATLSTVNDREFLQIKTTVENLCADLVCCHVGFEVLNAEGEIVRSQDSTSTRVIFPGELRVFSATFAMTDLPSGTYTARTEVDYGVDAPLESETVMELPAH